MLSFLKRIFGNRHEEEATGDLMRPIKLKMLNASQRSKIVIDNNVNEDRLRCSPIYDYGRTRES